MSIILVRTDQNYYENGVMSFAPMFSEYAFAIDCEEDLPIKVRMKRANVLEVLENLWSQPPNEYGKLVDEIKFEEFAYKGGVMHLIDFSSPVLEKKQMEKYQDVLKNNLAEFGPVLIEGSTLDAFRRAQIMGAAKNDTPERLSVLIKDIAATIFKVPREKRLLEKSVQKAFDQKDPAGPTGKML